MNNELFPFTITIDDGYGAYHYKVHMPGDVCIRDIIEAIKDKFPEGDVPTDGVFIDTKKNKLDK